MTLALLPIERRVLSPLVKPPVSEWAEEHVFLPTRDTAHGGPYTTELAPYQAEMMDAFADPDVEEVVLCTGTQIGKTQVLLNVLQYAIDQDPGPGLLVQPSEDDVETFNLRRIKPAVLASPTVARHMTGRRVDWKKAELAFDSMVLYCAGANSPAALAGKPIRWLWMDEVDKFPTFSGKEADPISLATERTRTFLDRKIGSSSTPTTEAGYIWRAWLRSDQAHYQVPCPGCGKHQALVFGRQSVQWPEDVRDPERIERERLAVYVCCHCGLAIEDDDETRREMLAGGLWVPEGARVANGRVTPARSRAVRGFHLNALYSPFLSWSAVAAKFVDATGDTAKLMNFTNSWLALPWREVAEETTVDQLRERQGDHQAREVPDEAVLLTAGVDVGKHWLHYVIRAWGYDEHSWLVEAGSVESFATLAEILFHTSYRKVSTGEEMPVRLACVDYGYDQDSVIGLCVRYPEVARPVKGYESRPMPYTSARLERSLDGRPCGLLLWSLSTTFFKNKLHGMMTAPEGARGVWRVHKDPREDYLQHLTAEHKTLVRSGKQKQVVAAWRPRPGGGENHWWDCEVYATAAAHMLGSYVWRRAADGPRRRSKAAELADPMAAAEPAQDGTDWIREGEDDDDWIGGGRDGWLGGRR